MADKNGGAGELISLLPEFFEAQIPFQQGFGITGGIPGDGQCLFKD
jgi:hypothetical protein